MKVKSLKTSKPHECEPLSFQVFQVPENTQELGCFPFVWHRAYNVIFFQILHNAEPHAQIFSEKHLLPHSTYFDNNYFLTSIFYYI